MIFIGGKSIIGQIIFVGWEFLFDLRSNCWLKTRYFYPPVSILENANQTQIFYQQFVGKFDTPKHSNLAKFSSWKSCSNGRSSINTWQILANEGSKFNSDRLEFGNGYILLIYNFYFNLRLINFVYNVPRAWLLIISPVPAMVLNHACLWSKCNRSGLWRHIIGTCRSWDDYVANIQIQLSQHFCRATKIFCRETRILSNLRVTSCCNIFTFRVLIHTLSVWLLVQCYEIRHNFLLLSPGLS